MSIKCHGCQKYNIIWAKQIKCYVITKTKTSQLFWTGRYLINDHGWQKCNRSLVGQDDHYQRPIDQEEKFQRVANIFASGHDLNPIGCGGGAANAPPLILLQFPEKK